MPSRLFFICPTDFLEPVINNIYRQENYFLSSLGNSMKFSKDKMMEIGELLRDKDIKEVSFVLSDDNRIISDALGKKAFSDIPELEKFYRNIDRQRQHCEEVWPSNYHQFLISSCYMNHKVMQLRSQLDESDKAGIHLSAKIYKRKDQVFRDICSFSIVNESVTLN